MGHHGPTMRAALAALCLIASAGAALADSFGAIVIDDDIGGACGNGDYAVGGASTLPEARRIAMSNCTLGGNVACTLKITYRHCGAYASSHPVAGAGAGGNQVAGAGAGAGDDQAAAIAAALAACGNGACRLIVADCVNQPLRPPG